MFSDIYSPDDLSNTLLSQSYTLGTDSIEGTMSRTHIPRTEAGMKSLWLPESWSQNSVLEVTSSWLPPPTHYVLERKTEVCSGKNEDLVFIMWVVVMEMDVNPIIPFLILYHDLNQFAIPFPWFWKIEWVILT